MGGEVVRYGNREESQPRTVGLTYALVDIAIPSPLDAEGSGLCSHTDISGTDRMGLYLAPHHT